MLQIIIWMMCFYFILKAVELWLIASSSSRETRGRDMGIAIVFGLLAVAAATFFFLVSVEQGVSMSTPPDPY